MYQISGTEGPQLVLPSNYVGELKTLPEDVLSAKEAIADVSNCPASLCHDGPYPDE